MKKKKSDRPANPNARTIIIQTKVNATEMRAILALAQVHAEGNMSLLIRLALKRLSKK